MLGSSPTKEGALALKQRADATALGIGDAKLVAVVRPPLKPWRLANYENKNYAVLLGLLKATGQVAFAFDEETANRVCREVYAHRASLAGAMHETVFRYEWPTPGSSVGPRHDRYRLCKGL